jgi:tetratricopeptide (TPR) repeat protein
MTGIGRALLACLLLAGSVALANSPKQEIRTLIADEDYQQAITRLERDDSLPAGERAELMARAYLGEGDWKNGLEQAERAVSEMPDDADAQLTYAVALRTKMDSVSKVRAMWSLGKYKGALERALEIEPDNVDARTEEIGYLTYAPGIAGGDKTRAQERIHELERLDFKQAMQMQVQLSRTMDDDDGWVLAMERLVRHDPRDEDARFQLAIVYIRLERFTDADPLLRKLENSDDRRTSLGATYQIGRSRVVGEYQVDQGVAQFERYLASLGEAPPEGLPSRAAAHLRLGEGLSLVGRVDEARLSLEQALRLDPEMKEAKQALARLSR